MSLLSRPLQRRLSFAFVAVLTFLSLGTAHAAKALPDHWVGTWAAAPVAAAPDPGLAIGTKDITLREIVHVSLGGTRIRIVFSNEFGLDPLTIGAAHAAISAGSGEIALTSANALTFSGRDSVTIPPGALAISDPADLTLAPLSDLAISIFVPAQPLRQITQHPLAVQTSYLAPGNVVGRKTLEGPQHITSWPFLKGVDVYAPAADAAIVTFGDSITDGYLSTVGANARWPDILARRLQADKKTSGLAILNEGISANRVLHDGYGASALARFDRDVIAQAGVKYVVLLEGINDIGVATSPKSPHDVISADDLIAGLTQLVERAHAHNIKVIGATLTPFTGAGYQSPAGEAIRVAVNDWVRTYKPLDGIADFDLATRDPSNPSVFLPADDSGDHLHPNDAGYKAMGDSVDLKLFTGK